MLRGGFLNIILLILGLSLLGCSNHIAPIPTVEIQKSGVYHQTSKELEDAKAFGKELDEADISPIYLFMEEMKTSIPSSMLPYNIRLSTIYAGTIFGKKVIVIDNLSGVVNFIKDKKKRDRLFMVSGTITGFNKNRESKESGVDFGLDFGKGKGDSDVDNDFNNEDTLSSLTISIFFKKYDGKVVYSQKSTIDIHSSSRGYYFGISINGSGFGLKAYNSKKEAVGEALDRALYYSLHQLLKKALEGDLQSVKTKKVIKNSLDKKILISKKGDSKEVIQLHFEPTIPSMRCRRY